MCEIVKSETLNGPWAIPNRIVNHCPRASRFWVQSPADGNLAVCSQHLAGTVKRLSENIRHPQVLVVKTAYPHPDGKHRIWR